MRIPRSWTWSAMSQQPFRSQLARVCVLCFGCSLLSYPIIWRAEYHALKRGQVDLVNLQHEIGRLRATINALKAKQAQWQILQHQTDEKTRLITGPREPGTLIEWLEKETARYGVEIKRMTWPTAVNTENSTDDFLEMEWVELTLKGDFYAILDVFNAATQHSPRLLFSHMSWTRVSEDSAQLNVTAKGRMYRVDERRDRE